MSMPSFEQQQEKKLRGDQAESQEAGFEGRESKEQQEDKEMGAKEKMEQTAVEVKNTKQRMQNIMVNMQQVIQAVRAIRQQLGLIDNGNVPAVKEDQKALDDLKKNLKEVLDLYIDEPDNSNWIFRLPNKNLDSYKNILQIAVDPNVLFAQQLRMLRLKHNLTQQDVSIKMGYKNVWAYQKYEKHKVSPTLNTLAKIKKIFPEFNLNSLF